MRVTLTTNKNMAELSCIHNGEVVTRQYEAELKDTRNQGTLQAMITAIEHLNKPCTIEIHTDNIFVRSALSLNWPAKWQQTGWIRSNGGAIANKSDWIYLMELLSGHRYEVAEDGGTTNEEETNNERTD